MRSALAAVAATSALLLIGACAGPDTTGPEAEASPTPEASATSESVDVLTTCRGYYDGGEHSIDHRVTTWASAVADPATDENLTELTIVRDRLDAQIRYAETGPAALLESVRAPFAASLEGEPADPENVVEATDAVQQMCTDAGYQR
ncbi:hypothetical protein [Isoptericola halotolerans]|uniref:Lipoprotein n=1 Tax=Isoptericola halotolerans TaxID=300560 RepID=A0ABX2A956_9MICO|nr:hypothetical protein [Isoptericola halotolerans]NOV98417.1 hypothetical protein [Isoptericola halotolerans]